MVTIIAIIMTIILTITTAIAMTQVEDDGEMLKISKRKK